jgi:hypothetical protein
MKEMDFYDREEDYEPIHDTARELTRIFQGTSYSSRNGSLTISTCDFDENKFIEWSTGLKNEFSEPLEISFIGNTVFSVNYDPSPGFTFYINPSSENDPNILFCIKLIRLLAIGRDYLNIVPYFQYSTESERGKYIDIISKIINITGINIILSFTRCDLEDMLLLIPTIKYSIKGLICGKNIIETLIGRELIYTEELKYLEIYEIRAYTVDPVRYAPLISKLCHLETLSIDDDFGGTFGAENFRDTIQALRNTQIDNLEFKRIEHVNELENLPYLKYLSCWYSKDVMQKIYTKVLKFRPIILGHFQQAVSEVKPFLRDPQCMIDTILDLNIDQYTKDIMEHRKIIHDRINQLNLSRGARSMIYGFMYGGRGSLMFIHSISPALAELIASYI